VFAVLGIVLVFAIVFYIFEGIGLYKMCKNAGIPNPWLAFIPIGNSYLLGLLAERSAAANGNNHIRFSQVLLWGSVGLMVAAVPIAIVPFLAPIVSMASIALSVFVYIALYYIYRIISSPCGAVFNFSILWGLSWVFLFRAAQQGAGSVAGYYPQGQPKYEPIPNGHTRISKFAIAAISQNFGRMLIREAPQPVRHEDELDVRSWLKQSNGPAVIAGNWKMNKTAAEARALIGELLPLVQHAGCEVVLCTPYLDLAVATELTRGTAVRVGAQNCHWAASGAFTGEVSAAMLREAGFRCDTGPLGAQQKYFGETDATVARLRAALDNSLEYPLRGELLEAARGGLTDEILRQCRSRRRCAGVSEAELAHIYHRLRAVWAIGTGKNRHSPAGARFAAVSVRCSLRFNGQRAADGNPSQYGGSMNAAKRRR
jgi:triosephosphate isomerase